MALTRKFLSALGIEEEKAEQIRSAHLETVDPLKAERDKYKEDAEKLSSTEQELSELKKTLDSGKEDSYKVKYEALKEDFEEFKKGIETEKLTAKKESAYRQILKDVGISDKRIASILKVSDINKIEFDEEGKVQGEDKLKEEIRTEWSDFIQTAKVEGASVANPPSNSGSKTTKTREEIRAIKDAGERQKAMLENPSLFGLDSDND